MQSYSHNPFADDKRSFNSMITAPPPPPLSSSSRNFGLMEKPQQQQPLKCPRCDSSNTKFCYYNNYSLSQPRHFCKACKRYWTRGGTLRNVPVGGGCRKNKRLKRPNAAASSTSSSLTDGSLFSACATNPNNNPQAISKAHMTTDVSTSAASNNHSNPLIHGLSYASNNNPPVMLNGLGGARNASSNFPGGYGALGPFGLGACTSSSSVNGLIFNSQVAVDNRQTVLQDPLNDPRIFCSLSPTSLLFSDLCRKQTDSKDSLLPSNHLLGLARTQNLESLQDLRVRCNSGAIGMEISEERKTEDDQEGQTFGKNTVWNQIDQTAVISDPSLYSSWSANGAAGAWLDQTNVGSSLTSLI